MTSVMKPYKNQSFIAMCAIVTATITNSGICFSQSDALATAEWRNSISKQQVESSTDDHESASYFELKLVSPDDMYVSCELYFNSNKELKPSVDNPSLAFSIKNELLSAASVTLPKNEKTSIPLVVEMPLTGQYEMVFNEVHKMPAGSCMYLEDLATGETLPMIQGAKMKVDPTLAYEGNRFRVMMTPPLELITHPVNCPASSDGAIEMGLRYGDWHMVLESASSGISIAGHNASIFDQLPAGNYQLFLTPESPRCQSSSVAVNVDSNTH